MRLQIPNNIRFVLAAQVAKDLPARSAVVLSALKQDEHGVAPAASFRSAVLLPWARTRQGVGRSVISARMQQSNAKVRVRLFN